MARSAAEPLEGGQQAFDVGARLPASGPPGPRASMALKYSPSPIYRTGLAMAGPTSAASSSSQLAWTAAIRAQGFLVRHFGEPGGGDEDPVQRRVSPDRGLDEERRRAFRGCRHGGEILGEQPVQPFQQDRNHRLLVREVVQQPALGDAGPPRDGIQRRGTFAHFDQQGFEGVEDGFAGDGFPGACLPSCLSRAPPDFLTVPSRRYSYAHEHSFTRSSTGSRWQLRRRTHRAARGPWRDWLALALLMFPVLLVAVDNTALTFALPAIASSLDASGVELLWIVDAYPLVLAGLLVAMGSLGDRIGRRRLLFIGSTGFAAVSAVTAFAPSAEWLIAGRAGLGLFGAMLMPSTLSLIRNIFPQPNRRRLAVAIWAAGFSGGAALGPIVGGWLVEHFWWGAVLLVAVPIILPLLLLGPALIPESRDPNPGRVDVPSIVLSLLVMVPVVYGIKVLATHGPALEPSRHRLRPAHGLCLHPAAAAPACRVEPQDRRTAPRRCSTSASSATGSSVRPSSPTCWRCSPSTASFCSSPSTCSCWRASPLGLRRRHGPRPDRHSCGGPAGGPAGAEGPARLCGGRRAAAERRRAISWWPSATTATARSLLLAALLVLCLGVGAAETISNDLILGAAPAEKSGAAAAISETGYEIGSLLGTAILGSILTASYQGNLRLPAGVAEARPRRGRQPRPARPWPGPWSWHRLFRRPLADAVMAAARTAFDSGVHITAAIALVLMSGACVLAAVVLRSVPKAQ